MTTLALLLVFPLLWPFVAKAIWKHEITAAELAGNIAIGVVVVLIGWFGGRHLQTLDHEVLNGQVTGKTRQEVSCEHSYSCNCRQVCSGTGNSRTCSEVCSTCHEHSYDVDWLLRTNVGDIEIDRVDRRGTTQPLRFERAAVGDPVAKMHGYTNYVKAAPESLFNTAVEKAALARFSALVPAYPNRVYDYHYVDRVLAQGVNVPDLQAWNTDIAQRLRTLGPAKQVNLVVVFTSQKDPQYATALRAAWLGGKKNDVVVVFGAPAYPAIEWVRVVSWTDKELFKVQLRDALLSLKTADRTSVLQVVTEHVERLYVRKPMQDFEYLVHDIEPPLWLLLLLVLLSVAASVGASRYFANNRLSSHSRAAFKQRRF